jgi:hypothetical protein
MVRDRFIIIANRSASMFSEVREPVKDPKDPDGDSILFFKTRQAAQAQADKWNSTSASVSYTVAEYRWRSSPLIKQ